MTKYVLSDLPKYATFIEQRDRALETILTKYQVAISNVMRSLEERIEEILAHSFAQSPSYTIGFKNKVQVFDKKIQQEFTTATIAIVDLWFRLRRSTRILTVVAETEAMGRALGTVQSYSLTHKDLSKTKSRETFHGGSVEDRVELALDRIRRDLVSAFQHSMVLGSDYDETYRRVMREFPAECEAKKPRRHLKPRSAFQESNQSGLTFLSTGYMDEDEWAQVMKDYLDEQIPPSLFPRSSQDYTDKITDDGVVRTYDWEVEQAITEDFVKEVRDGQSEAANNADISDLQWVAILDGHTCSDCCVPRDGLTSTEIEQKLNSGDISDDCDAIVPPAHIKCRCKAAPVSEQMPEESPPDFGEFDDWLVAKGNQQ